MRRWNVAKGAYFYLGVASALLIAGERNAEADLIRSAPERAYPAIDADVHGGVSYNYDPASQTGTFRLTNTPYMIAGGPSSNAEFDVTPDAQGVRSQVLTVRLDSTGRMIAGDPSNSYELRGTISAGGKTYGGVLLTGVPTGFGWSAGTAPVFDLNLKITGGALAQQFGSDAYLRIKPMVSGGFAGSFLTSFQVGEAASRIESPHPPEPFPVAEPATLAILLVAGGLGLARRRGPISSPRRKNRIAR
ncbi:MAG: hypothetical protein NVSMB14_04970 [Isosphaeraceae bacterium]